MDYSEMEQNNNTGNVCVNTIDQYSVIKIIQTKQTKKCQNTALEKTQYSNKINDGSNLMEFNIM